LNILSNITKTIKNMKRKAGNSINCPTTTCQITFLLGLTTEFNIAFRRLTIVKNINNLLMIFILKA